MENTRITGTEMLPYIREHECTTKEAALKKLDRKITRYMEKADDNVEKLDSYGTMLVSHLVVFREKIEKSVLFDTLPDEWAYYFDYSYDEFSLNIEHIYAVDVSEDGEVMGTHANAIYKLVTLNPINLSIDKYCEIYKAEQGTVRQWIRRGKIRTAFKLGNAWKIPALTPTPSRGYEPAQYKWISGLDADSLPEDYAYLADYVLATFYQDRADRTKYHVLFVAKETFYGNDLSGNDKNKELVLDAKEREKLELFMIAHPQIKYCGIVI